MSKIDWLIIKNEYINTKISYRKLADKYKISFSTLEKKARAENWKIERDNQCDKIETKVRQKTQDKIVAKGVKYIDRITSIADTLLIKLEQATQELDCHLVVNKTTAKKYLKDKNDVKIEITNEQKDIAYKQGIIKVNEVKQLASALKDLKEIQASTIVKSETDVSQLYSALESEGE